MIDSISIEKIRAARKRISSSVLRTPLVRFHKTDIPAQIYLKLENLQPIGSFKLRGAGNAIKLADKEKIAKGVYTASMGNMAQGIAWNARRLGIPCVIVVPDNAPETKLKAIRQLGGKIIKVSFNEWWQVLLSGKYEGIPGFFIHPVCDPAVIAGHGTIGIEILEDLPDVNAVIIPFGGGALSSGIASAIRALKPDTKIYACEVETAAPLALSLKSGRPREVSYKRSFVEGIGGKSVLPEMWALVSKLLDGSLVMSLEEIAAAIRMLIEYNCVVAEGAGAAPVAAALAGKAGTGKVVCVVSGGNIDSDKLVTILNGQIP
ncbi:MAG: threonine/serine dehydratase [Candidatus Aminicenantes bacterium]|nr:MAG: threonine/serine dehydratase [Candidatus Aminicenantes bacterium]